jgi:uncharacterized protein YaiI (UPF0178 family)
MRIRGVRLKILAGMELRDKRLWVIGEKGRVRSRDNIGERITRVEIKQKVR